MVLEILKLFQLCVLCFMSFFGARSNASAVKADVGVGVILDLDTTVGRIYKTSISMAIEDFYSEHTNYTTRIVPHFRDSSSDVVAAASAAIDLLKNVEVLAILGPLESNQADFVVDIGDKVRVPIISPATSPSLSPKESPYLIRSALCSASHARAVAALVKAFGWREVVFVYEDSVHGIGLVPLLTQSLLEQNAVSAYQSAVSRAAGVDQILEELGSLKSQGTRVFVVHMGPELAARFFRVANEAGMMSNGYVWIAVDVLTGLLDSDTIEAMQGVVSVKPYVPRRGELKSFTKRWSKRFHMENPEMDGIEVDVFGLWAYDSIKALAEAIERAGLMSPRFKKPAGRGNLTDLEAIGTSNIGTSLAHSLRNIRFKGLSGFFNITNGELQPSAFEIVNVIGKGEITIGFWTEEFGISKKLESGDHEAVYSTKRDNLRGILWPGQTSDVPKGWEIRKKLRVGVPISDGFGEIIKVERDAETGAVIATGFCIDVFEEAMRSMPYDVPYEYIPFGYRAGDGNYDDLVYQIFLEKYDAVVADVTITAKRSKFVDFTVPYLESGVATVVPIKDGERKNAWIFMKPLTTGLWLTIGAFFVFTGLVVWVLERRVNEEFRGPPLQQVGMIFWFSFSTLVFAHREKVINNLTRFVVIVWVFVVLVLSSSYTASLTSMLTVQQLQSADMIKNGEHVGYQNSSYIIEFLKYNPMFESPNFVTYSSPEQFDAALSRGSRNGGVAAIFDEIPYIKLFLTRYPHKYTMISPTYRASGWAFAFSKGSPLVSDVSTAILNLKESEKMVQMLRNWLGDGSSSDDRLESLDLERFKGLFLIAGLSSSSALVIYFFTFLYENRYVLRSTTSMKQKMYGLSRKFYQGKIDAAFSEESRNDNHGGIVPTSSPATKQQASQMIKKECESDNHGGIDPTSTPATKQQASQMIKECESDNHGGIDPTSTPDDQDRMFTQDKELSLMEQGTICRALPP